jgi:hypothetical protein
MICHTLDKILTIMEQIKKLLLKWIAPNYEAIKEENKKLESNIRTLIFKPNSYKAILLRTDYDVINRVGSLLWYSRPSFDGEEFNWMSTDEGIPFLNSENEVWHTETIYTSK